MYGSNCRLHFFFLQMVNLVHAKAVQLPNLVKILFMLAQLSLLCDHTSFKAGGYRLPFLSFGGLYFLLVIPAFLVLICSSRKFIDLKLSIRVVCSMHDHESVHE